MLVDHGERDHDPWSASGSKRCMKCSGCYGMQEKFRMPDVETLASARGTATHQISDKCLKSGANADTFLGKRERTKSQTIIIDQELVDSAQMYIDYCRGLMAQAEKFWIEERFSLEKLKPPMRAGGTSDFIAYLRSTTTLHVVDLKNGRGLVEVKGNSQGRHYGLGAVLLHSDLKITHVSITIVQPNAYHPDGRIRTETIDVAELMEFVSELKRAWRRAAEAAEALETMHMGTFAQEYLTPGEWCDWCDAVHACPAVEQKAMDQVGVWFDDLDKPHLNDPKTGTGAEIAADLLLLDMIEDWITARRAHAKYSAEMGVEIPGHVLVESEGREAWIDGVEDKVEQIAALAGLKDPEFRTPGKLRTPKQIRTALGKKSAHLVEGLSATPKRGLKLVPSDTEKEAITPPVRQFFSVITDQ